MKLVIQNLQIIQDLLEKPSEDLDIFIEKSTNLIYRVLDRFIVDLQSLVSFVPTSDEVVTSRMKNELEYLLKMKEMDNDIIQKRKSGICEMSKVVMTSVVPISGLIMARFHMYECELKTSIEIWGHRSEPIVMTPSPDAEGLICFSHSLFFCFDTIHSFSC
jgi:hypothetical protein